MLDGPPSQSNCDHWRAGCGETRTPRSGTGRRKRTPTRGTSPAAEFTREGTCGKRPAATPAPRPQVYLTHDRAGKTTVTSKDDLKSTVISGLRRLQKLPGLVRGFFADPCLRYITA
jgi:hypothetical protein